MSPKLPAPLESILVSAASGFNRSTANGPAAFSDLIVIHTPGLISKIVLLFANGFSVLASRHLQPGDLSQEPFFLAVAQLVQTAFNPLICLVFTKKDPAQFPQVFAGVVEVQHLHCTGPPVSGHIPN